MIIVAGGDSFVYGSELADCTNNNFSNNTFTAVLAQGHEYKCVAWPGFGNDSIARTVINQCEKLDKQNTVVIVSWTFPGRYEFRFDYDTRQRNSPWYTITPWTGISDIKTVTKEFANPVDTVIKDHTQATLVSNETGVADFAKVFYRHVGSSECWEIYSSLKEILYLQNYLKLNGIEYLFTCADNIIFNNHSLTDYNVKTLINQIDQSKWFWFPAGTNPQDTCQPRGFYQWAIENKYPVGATHPLEPAHQDAVKLMQGKFNEMVKKSVQ